MTFVCKRKGESKKYKATKEIKRLSGLFANVQIIFVLKVYNYENVMMRIFLQSNFLVNTFF